MVVWSVILFISTNASNRDKENEEYNFLHDDS
jgi:hypothetical protein